jgi:OOP family OmpA-OmpF porin
MTLSRARAPVTAAALILTSIAARPAAAQQTGWALDRFEPTHAGDTFFVSDLPAPAPSDAVAARFGLVGDYALHPLVVAAVDDPSRGDAVVEHMGVLFVQAGLSVHRRIGLDFTLPIALFETGLVRADLPFGPSPVVVVGDPRLGVRVRLWGEPDRGPVVINLGAYGYAGFLGLVPRAANTTDGAFRGRVYANVSGRVSLFRWSATFGYHGRPSTDAELTGVGSEIYATASLALELLQGRLTVGPEAWISTDVALPFARYHVQAELIAAVHFRIADLFLIGAGIGPGLSQGPGTPAMRALLQFAFTPGAIRAQRRVAGSPTLVLPPVTAARPGQVTAPPAVAASWCAGQTDCAATDPDGDGMYDPIDVCPRVVAGDHPDPDRPGCPDGDGDGDGVRDHDDACRAVPPGPRPDPQRPGCPLVDRDGDHVDDAVDHCPDQPGAPNDDPGLNGCPGLVRLEADQLRILEPVFFASRRDQILHRSDRVLQAVADALRARPDIRRISIEGHTDDVGDVESNIDLSQRRATAVMLWLAAHGIEGTRLEAHGYGEARPITPAHTAAARATNRRVEFHVMGAQTRPPGASR